LIGFRSNILCFSMESVIQQVRKELGIDGEEEEEDKFQPDTSENFSLEMSDDEGGR